MLVPGEVMVHRVGFQVREDERRRFEGLLSDDERRRAARFRFVDDRTRFVVARGSLRAILSRYGAGPPDQLTLLTGSHGKPMLPPPSPLHFNVSHSGSVGLVAVALGREVGVDVEQIRPLRSLRAIARRFFAPAEVAALERLAPSDFVAGFYRCWTRKEAYVKARGLGLSLPLEGFEVAVGAVELASGAWLQIAESDDLTGSPWHVTDLEVPPAYVAALAVSGSGAQVRMVK